MSRDKVWQQGQMLLKILSTITDKPNKTMITRIVPKEVSERSNRCVIQGTWDVLFHCYKITEWLILCEASISYTFTVTLV